MRLRNLFYVMLALPLVFAACEKGSEDADKTPEVKEPVLTLTSSATVDVTATGGEFEITYTLENAKEGVELTATCEADWVDVTVGDKVKVVVEANEGEAREAKVVVAYEAQKFEVTYKQVEKGEVVAPALTLTSEETMEFTAAGGKGEITYTLENPAEGVELEAACEAEWVSDVVAGEKVTFAVAANEGEARETKIVVAYGEQKFEVAVKQAAKGEEPKEPVLTLTSEETLEFTAAGGEGEITYTLENPAEGVELEAACEAEWVSDVVAGEKVTFVVAANEGEARETKIVVAYGEQKFEVAVKQAEKGEEPLTVFAKATSTRGGKDHVLTLTTEDESVKLVADIYTYNSQYGYLYDGVYTVKNSGYSFNEGEIDYYYSNLTKGEDKAILDSGTITVAINDDLTYNIAVEIKDANGRELKGEFKGAVEGMSFENGFEWVAASRNTISGGVDGQFNITFKTTGTDSADSLTIDFYAEEGAAKLPAGTYTIANSTEANHINLSTLSFTTFSYGEPVIDGGEVVVENPEGNTYKITFRMTEKDSRRTWVCTYEGEIYNMEIPVGGDKLNFVSANGYYSGDSCESYVYLVADNGKQLKLGLLDLGKKQDYITPGTYNVSANWADGSIYSGWYGVDWSDGVEFKSGSAIFEDNGDSTYTVTVDITLSNGDTCAGVYVGAIEGYTLPSAGGNDDATVELDIASAKGKAYSTANNYGVMLFTPGSSEGTVGAGQDVAYVSLDFYNLDSSINYIAAGTYVVGGTNPGELDKAYTKLMLSGSKVTEGSATFAINGDKTYTVTFNLSFEDGKTYTGSYTGNILGITLP